MQTQDSKLAVLIDGDNIPSAYVKEMMEEIAKYGSPTIKRIYGDWTKPHLNKWKKILLENAINPVQQYSYTIGKNATDSAMIIDAMDILYSGKVTGFCIVSSDSDFTRLATRLREAAMTVIGIGEKKTPNPFIVACDKFIYLEILKNQAAAEEDEEEEEVTSNTPSSSTTKRKTTKRRKPKYEKITPKVVRLISNSISDVADEDGWAFLGEVGNLIQKKQPNFDSRIYGFDKLTPLIDSTGKFEIERRENQRGRFKLIYVRRKGK
ncbi:MAG: NYN domain-containing protein [Bacteroidota bacterium]